MPDRTDTDEIQEVSTGTTPEMEIIGPEVDGPDLSDLETLIFNVELRNGEQFSLIVRREEGMKLSMTADHEGEMHVVKDGEDRVVSTRFVGRQAWEFVVVLEEEGDG
jgi:diadenosine tetraphosphatase ApaH/serine/threonine PP2A family protein phosphatase